MAVLVEAISVIIRADALLAAYGQDWAAFKRDVPNSTLCADGELVRVGFMTPTDVEAFVKQLGRRGLVHLDSGEARHLVVVDQLRGPTTRCSWIEFGHVNLKGEPSKRIAACRLKGSVNQEVVTPDGWTFGRSLSASFGFVPTQHVEKSLRYLGRKDGLDVYWNESTGQEVYVGRTDAGGSSTE